MSNFAVVSDLFQAAANATNSTSPGREATKCQAWTITRDHFAGLTQEEWIVFMNRMQRLESAVLVARVKLEMDPGSPLSEGWSIVPTRSGWDLKSPKGTTMSPNMAPAEIRDEFRAWRRGRA
ncbi:hypothetical protein LCGC14_1085470 [marine sediment metagenome]|uniref:Uncharacterized protein n=1 Tax=marine sediment metagenome TaxID=412755 RepID=A0A0F9ME42_9ZZZZ